MPAKLTTTINKIQSVRNQTNSDIINEFYQYMKNNDSSVHHKNNNLKVVIAFASFLGPDITFHDIKKKEQVLSFLNTKIKNSDQDPEKRWITTWNHYLNRIRLFFRWLYNYRSKEELLDDNEITTCEWETPEFVKIKVKKTKRQSPLL
jgi:integrase/recombinase XerD